MVVGFTTTYAIQCLSPLTFWVQIPLKRDVLNTTLFDKVCQWLATSQWFSQGTPVSSTYKTDSNNITEILLKVALNTINQTCCTYLISNSNLTSFFRFVDKRAIYRWYNLIRTCAGECDWLFHWEHKFCATYSANININYRLPLRS